MTGTIGTAISSTGLLTGSTSTPSIQPSSRVSPDNAPRLSTSQAPLSTLNQDLANAGSGNRNSGGLLPPAKIAIAVTVPLTIIIIAILVAVCLRRRHKLRQVLDPQTREEDDGGLPEHVSTMAEIKYHPSRHPQNSGQLDRTRDAGIVSVYELDSFLQPELKKCAMNTCMPPRVLLQVTNLMQTIKDSIWESDSWITPIQNVLQRQRQIHTPSRLHGVSVRVLHPDHLRLFLPQ